MCSLPGNSDNLKPLPSYSTLYRHTNSAVLAALSSPVGSVNQPLQPISTLTALGRQSSSLSSPTNHMMSNNGLLVNCLERGISLESMLMKQATEPLFSPSPPKAVPVTSDLASETEAAVQSLTNADILPLKPASVSQTWPLFVYLLVGFVFK